MSHLPSAYALADNVAIIYVITHSPAEQPMLLEIIARHYVITYIKNDWNHGQVSILSD